MSSGLPLRHCLSSRHRQPDTSRSGLAALLTALLLLQLGGCGQSDPTQASAPPPMPPVPVKTAQPLQKEVVEWDEYTGRIEPVEDVEIKSRVDGHLDKIHVQDGDKVKKGDLLFVIDPRPYQAELERAQGALEQAQSRLDLARNDLERAERLHKAKAISEEEYDARGKGVRESAAAVRSLQAAVRTARLNLEFTEIRAPIDGRIGRELVTVGNLVKADQTLLTRIVSVDPVYVYVDADERAVLKYRRLAQNAKRSGAREARIPVELALIDETGYPHRGAIDYLDPRLDPGTGTLRVRGVFQNPDELLSPGLFARVRIPGSAPHQALLLPERAIGNDQGQKFVWIAKSDGAIEYRKIVSGAHFGEFQAISEGLRPDESVVIEGILKLRPGAKIQAEPVTLSEASLDQHNAARP
jgi:multidrug efflux system membrane fusion protein